MNQPDENPPTLKTIAELTGFSLSTVSLSLRDGGKLKKETREKVLKAAHQIGYVPNRAGVRLRTGRTQVLTLALAADKNIIDYTRLLIQGIGNHIRGSAYHLNVIPEFTRKDSMSVVNYVLDSKIADGIILTHTTARDPRVKRLMEKNFPFVTHGRTAFSTSHPFHDFDAESYVAMAVERLVAKGRTRPVLAAIDNGTLNFTHIARGFRKAVQRFGVEGIVIKNPDSLQTTSQARQLARELAAMKDSFDAIICNNELTALAIIAGLTDSGLSLAADYDIVCKQTTEILPMLYPEIDTVIEDLNLAGKELARLLVARIDGDPQQKLQSIQEPTVSW
ncbi:MAG: LacI family DNA-binding transcriptional regulator [Granulosicoccus sp.]